MKGGESAKRTKASVANLQARAEALLVADSTGRLSHVDASAASLLSLDVSTAIGRAIPEALPRPIAAPMERVLKGSGRTATSSCFECTVTLAGRRFLLRIYRIPQGVVASIAEREEQAASPGSLTSLLESEERFRALAEQPISAVFVLEGETFAYVNPEFCRIFGYRTEELLGRMTIRDLIGTEHETGVRKLIRRRLEGGVRPQRISVHGIRRDGEAIEVELYGSRLELGGRAAFLGVMLDITQRKQAEAALRERDEQLRHAQKLEAVGRLAGGIAHDFNNLLMVIQGSANLMLMDAPDGPSRGNLEEIVRATERAAGLTRQLLAFGRKQVLRPKVINLNGAVTDLHMLMRRVIGEDIELLTEPGTDLGSVRVDPGQLEQVVLNLVVNSRDAMPAGGRITIRTRNTELTPEDADRFPYRVVPGPYVCLCIQDTGHGMPQNVLERVFEPFFTTKEQGKGSGLGLSMVYGIVKQSGGYVWVTSTPGKGTTFEIYLPLVEESPDATEVDTPAAELRSGSGTVLLVEDEDQVRLITRRLLEQGGYSVVEASSGAEAIRIFKEHPERVDVLLTDVVMPRLGGAELANRLLEIDPELRVIYMSGYADNRGVRRGAGNSNHAFIQKPFSPEQLLERLQAVLGH